MAVHQGLLTHIFTELAAVMDLLVTNIIKPINQLFSFIFYSYLWRVLCSLVPAWINSLRWHGSNSGIAFALCWTSYCLDFVSFSFLILGQGTWELNFLDLYL